MSLTGHLPYDITAWPQCEVSEARDLDTAEGTKTQEYISTYRPSD